MTRNREKLSGVFAPVVTPFRDDELLFEDLRFNLRKLSASGLTGYLALGSNGEYRSLNDFVQRHPVFRGFRKEQTKITDRARPCLLIDHPQAIRRIARLPGCRPAKNMSAGYLDGEIARTIDETAAAWAELVPTLPPLPAEREQMARQQVSA